MRRLGCFRNHLTLSLEPSSRRNFNSIDSTPESFYDHLLRSCNVLSSLKQIHSSLTTSGFVTQNPHLVAQIIIKYTKYGEPNKARTLFNNLINVDNDDPSSFLWNSMLRAYANNGLIVETLDLYSLMRRNGVSVNNYAFPFVLKACASKSLIDEGHIIHADVVRIGFYSDKYVEASLVDMYAKCGQMDDGCKVFDKMLVRDLVSWTAMITAYEQAEKPEKAIMLFKQMQLDGILVDSITIVSLASAIGQLGDAIRAQSIHGYAISNGFLEDLCVGNTIIAMYAKCGEVEKARKVFDSIEKKDGISWNCILSGYTQNGQASEALLLFDEMLDFGCRPNPVTMLILVCACTYLGSSQLGRKIHDFIKRSNMAIDVNLLNALMDMYAKCGDLDVAEIMFKGIHPSERNVSSWNVLISGYGMHGHGRKALEFYRMMEEEGVEPDHITFTSVLSACSHAGLIDEGRKCFKDMVKFNVKHEAKHYACIVDMFGRSGLLAEAFDIIKQMQSPPNDAVWGALLLACRIHGNSELGEIAANNLFELEPEHPGYYVLMSNIYAMSKKWQEVGKLRRKMKNKGLKKIAAFSVIEYGNEFFGFHTGDQVNPYWREVYKKVESLAVEMKMAGYVPDLSCVLHDVEEEDKEHMLIYHSEKLAVAFGIMKNHVEQRMEIRVTKNLRFCNDCHSAFKLISSIYGRRIIVRDANRFHHFEGGICSCKDYWLGVNENQLAVVAVSRLQGELAKDGREPSLASKGMHENSTLSKSLSKSSGKSALEQFCVDLTTRASEGLIDPVIGRESEIQRIVQILCRRTKNNPILLGESGVGKTAIAEGLAIRIVQAEVPAFLLTKRIASLDIGLLMAGAKERGELEARVTTLIDEIQKSGDVILFIDEVHTLIGSGIVGRGNKGTGLDIANLLKPSLGRGELQCMASTTLNEYRTQFEKDKALARRFQPVLIKEPSQDDAIRILLGLREKYEAHHHCRYTLEAVNAAVQLSARYISDRYLPDKAIDLIDEAGSRARIESFKRKKEQQTCILSKPADDYWQEIRTVQAMHEVVEASRLKCDDNRTGTAMDDASEILVESSLPPMSDRDNEEPTVVGPDDIAAVASLWSGIPVHQLTVDERKLLVGLDEQLKKRVIGQDEAVAAISRAVKRSRVGLKDPDRPVAAMLFCGPTGVGKTELTKALAACYFGSETAMLRLDMSEYMERHTVSKLIGSPPGYVGYEEGGMLTEAIRRRPFTLLLLDEIEKAHPDIFNILLQLFEDGHLTDSQGRRVSFKNALIVMTSNVGSSAIAKGGHGSIGFLLEDDKSTSYAGMKALVIEELKSYFRPELLNRIDEVVVFQPLEKSQMLEILNMMLQEVKARLISLGIGLEVTDSIKDLICEQGYDQTYGARPLRRAVTLIVEDPLSEAILTGDYNPGDTAIIDLDATGNPFVAKRSEWTARTSSRTGTSSVF